MTDAIHFSAPMRPCTHTMLHNGCCHHRHCECVCDMELWRFKGSRWSILCLQTLFLLFFLVLSIPPDADVLLLQVLRTLVVIKTIAMAQSDMCCMRCHVGLRPIFFFHVCPYRVTDCVRKITIVGNVRVVWMMHCAVTGIRRAPG